MKLSNKQMKWLVCIILMVIFSIYFLFSIPEFYYYDSSYYWTTADGMFRDGRFNLYSFPETFRGYFFPTVVVLLKSLERLFGGTGEIVFSLFQSIMLALLIGILLPFLVGIKKYTVRIVGGIICIAVLVLYFWGDFLSYPLSDFPAFWFMCAAIAMMKYLDMKGENFHNGLVLLCGVLIGICLYAAYNTRAVYLYSGIIGFLWVIVCGRKQKKKLATQLIGILLGILLLATPQMMINAHYTDKASPMVLTENLSGDSKLEKTQVMWGVSMPRYESYVGSFLEYPVPGVIFYDKAGIEILNREEITGDNFEYATLLRLFLKYPLDMAGIYTRHLISILTPFFSEAYIHNLFENKTLRISIAIILWILGALAGFVHWKGKNLLKKENTLFLLLLLPCMMTLFGAVETRFAIGLYFLLYVWLCIGVNWKNIVGLIKEHFIVIPVICICGFMMWTAIVGDILASNECETMLISDTSKTYNKVKEVFAVEEIIVPDSDNQIVLHDYIAEDGTPLFPLEANTIYEINFSLECKKGQKPSTLYFDFAGSDYDNPRQDMGCEIKEGNHSYTLRCNSEAAPPDGRLRMISASDSELRIKDFKVNVVTLQN